MSTATAKKSPGEGSVRERLLAAANELFYEEGVHTVGIERVLERAGVAKASLYSTFGSKEELIRSYLEQRAEARKKRITDRIDLHEEPRAKILAIFDLLGEQVAAPTYRGCAFVNARAEEPRGEGKVTRACTDMRAWSRALFTELARDAGARDASRLGRELVLLYDGANVSASMDGELQAPRLARRMAEVLLDGELKDRGRKPR